MRIAIVGTGAMAAALGAGWAVAGHDVTVAGRSAERSATVAEGIGARTSTIEQVSAYGDVVLLAVHHRGIDETLGQLDVASLAGKILVDCMNPVETEGFTLELPRGAASISEYLADRTPARVVKAFNMAEAHVWKAPPTATASGATRPVLTAAADVDAAAVVAGLIADLGFRAVNVGGLVLSVYLEAAAALVITLLINSEPSGSMLTWLRPTEAVVTT